MIYDFRNFKKFIYVWLILELLNKIYIFIISFIVFIYISELYIIYCFFFCIGFYLSCYDLY